MRSVWDQIDALVADFGRELKTTSRAVRELKKGGG